MTAPVPAVSAASEADDDLIAQGARAIMRASGVSEALLEQYWPGEIAHYREMVAKHGDRYASSGSTITDAMRASRAALEVFRAAAPGPGHREAIGLEPPGCPIPGACACPGGEARLAERLGEMKRERDAAVMALGERDHELDEAENDLAALRRAERDAPAMILFVGLCGGEDKAEWMAHVAEVNAHALRMQERAERAESGLNGARNVIAPFARYAAQHTMLDDAEGEIGEFYPGALRVSISYRDLRAARDFAAQSGGPARGDLAQTYGHSADPAAADNPEEPDFDGPTPALLRGADLLKTLLAQKEEDPLLRVRAALRSLPSSRRDLDRMGEAIRALPGSPVVGRAIGDGR